MMWLPKFIFIFQTIPLIPPKQFFTQLNSLLTSFVWSNKAHRLSRTLLQNVRTEGGLKLPNLELYFYASQMFYIDRIINNTAEEPWIYIESNQLKPQNLFTALFTKRNIKVSNFVTNSTLKSWNKIGKILGAQISIPIKLPMAFFTELEQKNFTICMET